MKHLKTFNESIFSRFKKKPKETQTIETTETPRREPSMRMREIEREEEEKIPCVYYFLTKELIERLKERGHKHIAIVNHGYSLYCETQDELDNFKAIYKVGDRYKNEKIVSVSIGQPQQ